MTRVLIIQSFLSGFLMEQNVLRFDSFIECQTNLEKETLERSWKHPLWDISGERHPEN